MSKKNLTKPLPNRQPTSDEMDTFVKGGVGKDTELKTSVKQENDSRLTVDLPRAQHRRLQDCLHGRGYEDER